MKDLQKIGIPKFPRWMITATQTKYDILLQLRGRRVALKFALDQVETAIETVEKKLGIVIE